MIRILHSVSNMDRAGIETMLMNYYRHIDRSKIQFDFLCNKKKPGAYDAEIKEMGGNIYHTPGLNPAKYPSYLKCMKKIFEENPEYKIVEAHNGALGVYALHAAKVNHIPVRIFHAHGASITRDWKLPIKLVCKALLPSNMNQHFSCGIEAARCYFGEKVVERNDYELIPNAIEVNPTEKNRINKIRSLLSDMKIASRLLEVGCEDDFIPLLDTPMDYTETRNYIAQKIQEADDFLTGDKS